MAMTGMKEMMQRRRHGRVNSALGVLPPSRAMTVRSVDGTRLHTEVSGPDDGYPIVLCHGITCAIRYWAHQIHDLSKNYRVIAFDHRGHGRSGVPARGGYSLDLLAADLDAVLAATLQPHERAVIAGHSMGGIAITSWARCYPDSLARRADAVALINTTTGDLLRQVNLLQVPELLAATRVRIAHELVRGVGSLPVPIGARSVSRRVVARMALAADADPAVKRFLYDLFAHTPPAGRGGCAKMLAEALGPEHISVEALTVPTLVIGSEQDRLLPIDQSRKIAEAVPDLVAFVELPGGHCSNLEHPHAVNRHLRDLVVYATADRRATS